jgi:hypothetical protein
MSIYYFFLKLKEWRPLRGLPALPRRLPATSTGARGCQGGGCESNRAGGRAILAGAGRGVASEIRGRGNEKGQASLAGCLRRWIKTNRWRAARSALLRGIHRTQALACRKKSKRPDRVQAQSGLTAFRTCFVAVGGIKPERRENMRYGQKKVKYHWRKLVNKPACAERVNVPRPGREETSLKKHPTIVATRPRSGQDAVRENGGPIFTN